MKAGTLENGPPGTTPGAPGGPGGAPAVGTGRRVARERVVNLVNRLNFGDGELQLLFHGAPGGRPVIVPARPLPCTGRELECRWGAGAGLPGEVAGLAFGGFALADGLRRIHVGAQLLGLDRRGVRLALPEAGYDVGTRRARRHGCVGVDAELRQGERSVPGELVSFSATSFSVRLRRRGDRCLETDRPVLATLRRGGDVCFSGECTLVRQGGHGPGNTLVLAPGQASLRRFAAKRIRSDRQRPRPLPLVTFTHPLTGRRVSLRATDISGAGFSVDEEASAAVLFPGLVLPEVSVEFLPGAAIACRAQVLHGRESGEGTRRSGLAILEMDPGDHARLCAIVHRCRDEDAHVCTTNVDLEALWDFFFETGFLYPEKYALLGDRKASFAALYRRLYHGAPSISRHIIYQDRGAIYGHVSMLRFYRRTWLLHHHAAIRSPRHNAGMVVQEQMLRYINEFHHLPAARMRYIAAYYRPENRYASRVLGGAARLLADRERCSLDAFAYLRCPAPGAAPALPAGWTLAPADDADLAAFSAAYRARGGGLLDRALDLLPGLGDDAEVDREYAALGFARGRSLLALRAGGAPAALLVLNRSDVGLNLSELTNCVQLFAVEPGLLGRAPLAAALGRAAAAYPDGPVPALVHPRGVAEACGLPGGKVYELCLVDLEHYGPYLEAIMGILAPRTRAGRPRRG